MFTNLKDLSLMCQDLNLLYVEDDEKTRDSTIHLLNNFFKKITFAINGIDAIHKFKNDKFDLIISDINMPEMNGLEMLQKLREDNYKIPILMISAYNDSEYFIRGIELGIDGYILKPLVYTQFIQVLDKIAKNIKFSTLNDNYQKKLEKEVKKVNEEIIYKLHFDSLTNLLSRYSFFNDIQKLNSPATILVDIDKFKIINEVYGSDIGSKVLEKFSVYLSLAVDDNSCKIYRLSADEFAIVDTTKYINLNKYELMLENLFKKLNNLKIVVNKYTIVVDITIGLSNSDENIYENAKVALDFAKTHRKPYVIYSPEIDHRKESSLTLKWRDDIISAIDDKRVVAVYQPIVDKNANIIKYETLMRLQEEDSLKLISPFFFLNIAIKTRLYEYLSSTIIFKALNLLNKTNHSLSINFTYSDIQNHSFCKELEKFFMDNKNVGIRTIFEITENESIENYGAVKSFIKRFRNYGVKIAIDDFGSGFSNFEYILEIEPDYLKIDGSLIKDIDTDSKSYTLVEAIVGFSHKLGIKVIAEYVHSEIIFNMLKKLDVDEYQGFHFSEPLKKINFK